MTKPDLAQLSGLSLPFPPYLHIEKVLPGCLREGKPGYEVEEGPIGHREEKSGIGHREEKSGS
jgi:hypothetical protein